MAKWAWVVKRAAAKRAVMARAVAHWRSMQLVETMQSLAEHAANAQRLRACGRRASHHWMMRRLASAMRALRKHRVVAVDLDRLLGSQVLPHPLESFR